MTVKPIDPRILLAFKEGLIQTFSVQMSTAIQVEQCETPATSGRRGGTTDIAAIMGIASSQHTGTLVLAFEQRTFLAVVKLLIAEDWDKISPENADCAAELLNIIFGAARASINEAGYSFGAALPSVSYGSNIRLSDGGNGNTAAARFSCRGDVGEFIFDVSIAAVPEQGAN